MKKDILTERCPVCNGMPYGFKVVTDKPSTYIIGCQDFVEVKSKKSRKQAVVLWNSQVMNATALRRKESVG